MSVNPQAVPTLMIHIVVASQNPVKMHAVLNAFSRWLPDREIVIIPAPTASGVSDQPSSDEETFLGALNRTNNAALLYPDADFWVGIEGGVSSLVKEMGAFAWVVIKSPDRISKSKTGTFFLPPQVVDLVHQGKELGDADDIVFKRQNSKQGNGAIGILTNDLIDRTIFYEHAVILALAPFITPQYFT
jgi:inosine/xanthosine triphosphatase